MTPSNKAEVVEFAMKCLRGKVLAIGDGANDVPMIQKADVGIGIAGQEGMQVNMSFHDFIYNLLEKFKTHFSALPKEPRSNPNTIFSADEH